MSAGNSLVPIKPKPGPILEIALLILLVLYLTPARAGWQIQTVMPANVDFTPSSLALDLAGNPHIACINQTNYHHSYYAAYKGNLSGDPWEIREVPGAGSAKAVKIFLDPVGLFYFFK